MKSRKIIGRVLGTVALLFTAAFASAPRVTSDVPMRPFGTQPAVEVHVNGQGPYLFLVDTGASGNARIDRSVVEQLGLPTVGQALAVGATGGAAVEMSRVALDSLDSLEIPGRRFQVSSALSRSYNVPGEYLPDIGGVLAFNLFASELLTLDFAKRRLRLSSGTLPAADGRTIVNYEERGGLPYLPLTIGGIKLVALIDTGIDRAFDLPVSMIRKLHLASYPRPMGQAAGVTGQVGIGEVKLAEPVTFGQHVVDRPIVTFSEAFEHAILGATFFHGYELTFDQKNKRVRIVRAEAGEQERQ